MPDRPRVIRVLKRIFWWCAAGVTLAVLGSNAWILRRAQGRVRRSAQFVRPGRVGIVLGTSPRLRGRPNLFFEGRMDAAADLYRSGKVRQLLVSGDNGTRGYDEPSAMKGALLARGVPASAIKKDNAGFRTLDTMARASAVFDLREAILISDDWHLPRCLYLADAYGLKAEGFSSPPLPLRVSLKTRVREIASRSVAVFEVCVLRRRSAVFSLKSPPAVD